MAFNTVKGIVVQLGADNKDLQRGLKRARTDIEKFQASCESIGNKLAIVGAGAVASAGGIVKATMDWSAAVNDLEDKTNMSAEACSKLLYIGEAVGLTTEDMSNSMAKMAKTVMTAAQQQAIAAETGRESVDVFTRYGIAIKDLNGNLLSQEQVFKNILEKHRAMANGLEKTNMEMEMFGRSGAKLNDLLNLTEKQMDGMTDTAKKCGLVVSHETTQAWEDFSFQLNETKMVAKGVLVQIGNAMLPELRKLADRAKDVATEFSALDDDTKDYIITVIELTAALGGAGLAIKGLAFAFGPLVTGVKVAGTAFGSFATFLTTVTGAAYATAGALAVVIGVLWKAVNAYQAYDAYGVDAFEIDGDSVNIKSDLPKKSEPVEQRPIHHIDDVLAGTASVPIMNNAMGVSTPGTGGGGGGADDSARKAEELKQKIDEITQSITNSTKETQDLSKAFSDAGDELELQGLDGAERVRAEIEREYAQKIAANAEWLQKYKESVLEAAEIRKQAEETGNADVIAKAQELLDERKAMEIAAAEEVAQRKLDIESRLQEELLARATQAKELEAEMKSAMEANDMSRYMEAVEQRIAMDTDEIAQKQELMQQYYDWKTEAETTQQEMMLNAINQFKDGFSSAFADAIVNGKNLGKALQDLTKQVITMYIQERIQKKLSSVLGNTLKAKDAAVHDAINAKSMIIAKERAFWESQASWGASAYAGMAAFTAAQGASKSIAAFAEGGLVTKPTVGLVGEVPHRKEGVFPLTDDTFNRFAEGIASVGGGGHSITLNVSAMDAESFAGWLETSGGQALRQFMADNTREFASESGLI